MTRNRKPQQSQWERFCALDETDAVKSDRYQDAGTYANTLETASTTDEEWAEAFWNAWNAWSE